MGVGGGAEGMVNRELLDLGGSGGCEQEVGILILSFFNRAGQAALGGGCAVTLLGLAFASAPTSEVVILQIRACWLPVLSGHSCSSCLGVFPIEAGRSCAERSMFWVL